MARRIDASLDPFDFVETDPTFVTQKSTCINAGGMGPVREADPFAFEVLGGMHGAGAANKKGRLAEHPRRKHGDRRQGIIALRQQRDIHAKRHFRDVPFAESGEAGKDLLNGEMLDVQIKPLDLNLTVQNIANVVVFADGQ